MRRRCFRLYRQARIEVEGAQALCVQPLTYMNRSGAIVHYFIPKRFAVEDLIVVCDNLDLPAGMIRVRQGGSSAGHNGLKSLIEALGSSDFTRVYVGIGRPLPATTVVEHVLGIPHDPTEQKELQVGISQAASATLALCRGATVEEVSRDYNRRNGTL